MITALLLTLLNAGVCPYADYSPGMFCVRSCPANKHLQVEVRHIHVTISVIDGITSGLMERSNS